MQSDIASICISTQMQIERTSKWGIIRWAKLSQIPPNVVFHEKTFVVPYVYNTQTMPLYEACVINK